MTRQRTTPLAVPAAVLVLSGLLAGCAPGGDGQGPVARPGTTPAISTASTASDAADASDDPSDGSSDGSAARQDPAPQAAALVVPEPPTTVLAAVAAEELAVAVSAALFSSAPVVVLAPRDDPAAQARAARAAVAAGMPMLLTPAAGPAGTPAAPEAASPGATRREVERLGATAALSFGAVPDGYGAVTLVRAPDDDDAVARLLDVPVAAAPGGDPLAVTAGAVPGELTSQPAAEPTGTQPAGTQATGTDAATETSDGSDGPPGGELPEVAPGTSSGDVRVLSSGDPAQLAAVATARAAGAEVLLVPGADPRASGPTVQAIAAGEPATTVALGPAFGDAATLERRLATAATGVELPGGGQLVLPGKTYVALYGSPVTASLGVLGEQGPEETVRRAQEHASWYAGLTGTTVVPTLEIIATVASGQPGSDGDYSNEWPVEDLRPLVDLAGQNGLYVVLDLQPGRTDFLTQAQQYEELLLEPHVGLALDPEWRLRPDQRHLRQIGQVDVAEVDRVVTWLADLTRDNNLPQKLLVLHQFQVRMIPGADSVDQSRSELAVLVHVDGQGPQPAKQDTWRVLRRNQPSIRWWGWKNFYDEDSPMLTPEQTVQVDPVPQFITYQ